MNIKNGNRSVKPSIGFQAKSSVRKLNLNLKTKSPSRKETKLSEDVKRPGGRPLHYKVFSPKMDSGLHQNEPSENFVCQTGIGFFPQYIPGGFVYPTSPNTNIPQLPVQQFSYPQSAPSFQTNGLHEAGYAGLNQFYPQPGYVLPPGQNHPVPGWVFGQPAPNYYGPTMQDTPGYQNYMHTVHNSEALSYSTGVAQPDVGPTYNYFSSGIDDPNYGQSLMAATILPNTGQSFVNPSHAGHVALEGGECSTGGQCFYPAAAAAPNSVHPQTPTWPQHQVPPTYNFHTPGPPGVSPAPKAPAMTMWYPGSVTPCAKNSQAFTFDPSVPPPQGYIQPHCEGQQHADFQGWSNVQIPSTVSGYQTGPLIAGELIPGSQVSTTNDYYQVAAPEKSTVPLAVPHQGFYAPLPLASQGSDGKDSGVSSEMANLSLGDSEDCETVKDDANIDNQKVSPPQPTDSGLDQPGSGNGADQDRSGRTTPDIVKSAEVKTGGERSAVETETVQRCSVITATTSSSAPAKESHPANQPSQSTAKAGNYSESTVKVADPANVPAIASSAGFVKCFSEALPGEALCDGANIIPENCYQDYHPTYDEGYAAQYVWPENMPVQGYYYLPAPVLHQPHHLPAPVLHQPHQW